MTNRTNHDESSEPSTATRRTTADEIAKNDPHKVEKLANAGKDADVAEKAEQE